jgi:hypothetical protein
MGYLLLLLFLAICIGVPISLGRVLKRRIADDSVIKFIQIFIGAGLIVVLSLLLLYFVGLMGDPSDSVVTNDLGGGYYCTQQKYGYAFTTEGVDIDFYKKRMLWFDRKIGHIDHRFWLGEEDVRLVDITKPGCKEIIIAENGKVVMDTIVDAEKGFDITY